MYSYSPVALVTLLALLLYFIMAIRVGGARVRFEVPAPATTGNPEFERHYRVQMNTLEGLAIFLPSLWLFAMYVNVLAAAALGVVWIIGRLLYMLDYVKDPKKRGRGFGIQALASIVLLLGSIGSIIWDMVSAAMKSSGA